MPPLHPRPGLFRIMLGIFALWIALLLILYFTTVFPHRNDRPRLILPGTLPAQTSATTPRDLPQ